MKKEELVQNISADTRKQTIVRVGVWGIVVNVAYAVLKGLIGVVSGSIAILLDAVNNLSDAVSSIIAVGGIKLAMKPADKFHPFGHGRIEYISAMVIAVIIVAVGAMSIIGSVSKILHPSNTHYTWLMLLIMATGVVAKLWLGLYTLRKGKSEDSDSLYGSGMENLYDAIITFATIVSALIWFAWGLDLDGWFGAAISIFLIVTGAEIMRDTFDDILGHRVDSSLSKQLKSHIASFPDVMGAYDLILNNYGPSRMVGSVNIEVPEDMNAKDIQKLTERIQRDVEDRYRIYLAIGIYASARDEKTLKFQNDVRAIVMEHSGAIQLHGFMVDEEEKYVTFDIVTDFSVKNREVFRHGIEDELHSVYPQYNFRINIDNDYSD